MVIANKVKIKLRKKYFSLTANMRKRKIKLENFTIISNNCWGGLVYQSYNMKYNTPTIGLFFMAEDYIKFLKNIKGYLNNKLVFIDSKNSKWYEELKDTYKFGEYPIGKLLDIEIHFLHYKDKNEAEEKWMKRTKRINWDRIIFKFSEMNNCSELHLKEFEKLDLKNKICFTCKKYSFKSTYYIKSAKNRKQILSSDEPIGNSREININYIINNLL